MTAWTELDTVIADCVSGVDHHAFSNQDPAISSRVAIVPGPVSQVDPRDNALLVLE